MRHVTWVLGLVMAMVLAGTIAASADQTASKKTTTKAAVPTSPINLNTASSQQLEALPGVGPAAAKRIVEYRQKNGSFKKIEELMNVKGFGEKTFLKLKPFITVADKADRPGGEK